MCIVRVFEEFHRKTVFLDLRVRLWRESAPLSGSLQVKAGAETAGVLAALEATNSWVDGRAT